MTREFRIITPNGEVWAEGSASLAAEYIRQMEPGDILEYRTVTPWRSEPACNCYRCHPEMPGMRLCSTCGNKRCPRAADHAHDCTRSNEPGEPGSLYEVRDIAGIPMTKEDFLGRINRLTEDWWQRKGDL